MPRTPRSQKSLIELYRIAVDEYRFEVKLNWDRMQYYAVVNSAIIAVGGAILRDLSSPSLILFSGLIFFVGLMMSIIGLVSTHRSQEYYQQTVLKKTIYEYLLGLHNPVSGIAHPNATLAIATTGGQQDVQKILTGKPPSKLFKRLFRKRIVSYFMWLLIFLALIDIAGIGYVVWQAARLPQNSIHTVQPAHAITVTGNGTIILNADDSDRVRVLTLPKK